MTVGIIGAGKIGQAVAKQTLRAGYSVEFEPIEEN